MSAAWRPGGFPPTRRREAEGAAVDERMAWERAGWVRKTLWAALLNLPVSARAMRARSFLFYRLDPGRSIGQGPPLGSILV